MRGMRLTAILLPVFIWLTGCQGIFPTPYQPFKSIFPYGGYSESKIENGKYNVSFMKNENTSYQQARNYLLYRCAEITIADKFDYFVIVSGETVTWQAVTIKLGKGPKPINDEQAYDARELIANLEPKIQRPRK